MCTLTYLPLNNEYIFTSNRDEHDSRADTLFPVAKDINGMQVFFPQDPKAGGTWIASSNTKRIAILLNGAFEAHKHRPPYRKSRGIILLDSFNYSSLHDFSTQYDLLGIEPFTLVQFDSSNSNEILELKWDGVKSIVTPFPGDQAHIWSSTQLYSKEIRQKRQDWFSDLLNEELDASKLAHFHEFGDRMEKENNIVMDRGFGLRTISISQIVINKEKTKFNYRNLIKNTNEDHWIDHLHI